MMARALETVVLETIGPETLTECPHQTGTLRRSWTVDPPIVSGNSISITFGYGVYYAIYVHEILENYHAPPTKAKFLEDPVNRHRADIPNEVMARVQELLGGI